ncbi:MAG: hypothetical protein AAGJ87_03560 [Pseudomonadota bacterium]
MLAASQAKKATASASIHYSEETYPQVYGAGVGFTPLGDEAFFWAAPALLAGAIAVLGLALFSPARRAAPGYAPVSIVTALIVAWFGLMAISGGMVPRALSPTLAPIAENAWLDGYFGD